MKRALYRLHRGLSINARAREVNIPLLKMTKKNRKKDPFAEREATRYEHPIASREFILQTLAKYEQPRTVGQLAKDLQVKSERDFEALRRRLQAMERDGQILRNRRDSYGLAAKMNLVRGRVIGHPDGYGFLVPDDTGDDLFLSSRQMRMLFHDDRVLASVIGIDRRGRREGAVVEVLDRNTRELVGHYFLESGIAYVVPDNKRIHHDILIPDGSRGKAEAGDIVVASITEQPTLHTQAVGRITEVLGKHMAPGMEIEIAIRNYQLPHQWPEDAFRESQQFAGEVRKQDCEGRLDLRDVPLVTIDGEDARDFDDAVFCQKQGRGWRLLVAIADVSAYVKPDSALDREARLRGNSVYFPQQVIPMLPEVLSNGLCSLNPDVDRLCMVCELSITPAGKVSRFRFVEAVMRSQARLTYHQVAAMLIDQDEKLCRDHAAILPHLQDMYGLYQVLRGAREKRGAIDFDRAETRIVFGASRKIRQIVPVVRNDAHKLIEEFMILANIAAAEFLLKHRIPAVFRVHQPPVQDKLTDVRAFLAELGLRLTGGDEPQALDYARLIHSVRERADRHLIETVLLRSLSQAQYSDENIGHFGLALDAYAHFTSPIRRYPDLIVHRAIRHLLRGGKPGNFAYSRNDMEETGVHTSMTERRADEATRDAIDWLKCEYMLDKVGGRYSGIVTAVTSFGLFIELDEIYVEGLLHVTELGDDYFNYDPVKHRMTGERSGKTYRIGDAIQVTVARVDLDERKIDFVLAARKAGSKRAAKKRR